MSRLFIGIAGLALAASSQAALAKQPVDREIDVDERAAALAGYEEVRSIPMLTRPYSFHVIDNDTLIIWRSPFDPYLVELRRPSPGLKFARGIGVTSSGSRIHARFDDVQVEGLRYPIDRIYKLDRAEARRLSETT